MEVHKKTIKYYKKSPINIIQYILSTIVTILFCIGLIPSLYIEYNLAKPIIIILLIQFIISLIRLRFSNAFIEIFLIIFALISVIPFFGYITRILGFIFSLFEIASFKNKKLYKKIYIRKFGRRPSQHTENNHRTKQRFNTSKAKIHNAKFKEK